jgi:hypothetical protein
MTILAAPSMRAFWAFAFAWRSGLDIVVVNDLKVDGCAMVLIMAMNNEYCNAK